MKNYEETAQSVLSRIHETKRKNEIRRKIAIKAVSMCCIVLMLAMVFIGGMMHQRNPAHIESSDDAYTNSDTSPTVESSNPQDISEAHTGDDDTSYYIDESSSQGYEQPLDEYAFEAFEMNSFLEFVKNGGQTHQYGISTAPLWSEAKGNEVFLKWLKTKDDILIPKCNSEFEITYSCVKENTSEYCFYLTNDKNECIVISISELAEDMRNAPLSELHQRFENSPEIYQNYDPKEGTNKLGEYLQYDSVRFESEVGGETVTLCSYPHICFKYGSYYVVAIDRTNADVTVSDLSFCDNFDLISYGTGDDQDTGSIFCLN